MEFIVAVVVGVLYALGIYLILRRSIVRIILGVGLLGHGSNMLIFNIGRLNRVSAPIIPEDGKYLSGIAGEAFSDPLPQALVLTAIVIGFGVLAFMLVLMREATQLTGTGDIDLLNPLSPKYILNVDNMVSDLLDEDVAAIEDMDETIDNQTIEEAH